MGESFSKKVKDQLAAAEVRKKCCRHTFDEMTALYRLDQTSMRQQGEGAEKDMGPLPTASKALLITLGVTWVLIAAYYIRERMKEARKN